MTEIQNHYNLSQSNSIENLKLLTLSFVKPYLQNDILLEEMLNYHFQSPGKFYRAKLLIKLALDLKIQTDLAMSWAIINELIHNSSLIFDDIQDMDIKRRDQTSLWKKYGIKNALNLANFLQFTAGIILAKLDVEPTIKNNLVLLLQKTSLNLVRGQSLEFQLHSQPERKHYTECVKLKTGSLFLNPILGVLELCQTPLTVDEKTKYTIESFSILFQMYDDWIDLYSNKKRGESGCDLKEGKISILVIRYLEENPQNKDAFLQTLGISREIKNENDLSFLKSSLEIANIKTKVKTEINEKKLYLFNELESIQPKALGQSLLYFIKNNIIC